MGAISNEFSVIAVFLVHLMYVALEGGFAVVHKLNKNSIQCVMQKHISRTLWKMNACLVNTATYLLLIHQFPWNLAWLEFLV